MYIGASDTQQYALQIQPNFRATSAGVEYFFETQQKGTIDHIVRTVNGTDATQLPPSTTFKKTFTDNGTHTINAKAYRHNELKAIASATIQHSASTNTRTRLSLSNTSLQSPTKATAQLIGKKIQDIQIITRNRGDGTISSGQSLSAEHQYLTSGIKTLQQTIFFTDDTRLTTIATFFVENPFTTQSIALNISGSSLSSPQYQPLNFDIHLIPKNLTNAIRIINTF
jgi:hypothetical protein